jgi:nucleotide-binding universal stress UspA family protein
VDGSEGSRSALAWAAAEAARAGADLRLVAIADEHPLSPRFPVRLNRPHAAEVLDALVRSVPDTVPPEQVSAEVHTGDTTTTLLEHLDHGRMLVVGKRGVGVIPRMLVGSTSLAVAGRSPVPVAVVPTGWRPEDHVSEPVVLGVDPARTGRQLLHLAFRRAERLAVPLVAVHGWEAPSALWADTAVDEWERESHEQFHEVLAPWRTRFPEVELRTVVSSHHPAIAVLTEAEKGAQLVLLGRHASSRFTGFVFGSVTRAVLHYSEVPVLVVPTDED